MPGVVRMLDPYTYRCPAGHPDPCPVCTGAPHLEEILTYEGPQTVAAVILETVTGTNGIIVPPDGYLQSIREVCDRHGILLITDEVMAGFGRTGRGVRDRTDEAAGEASVDRRRARPRLLLGPRAGQGPGDARAARAVQRDGRGCKAGRGADEARARPRPVPDGALERRHVLPA